MCSKDIRWIQRFNNYDNALGQLLEAVNLSRQRELSRLEKQGLIQVFEYTHELAWKVLKDFLEDRGIQNIYGSRDASREAFKAGLIINGEIWMDMIKSRNQTTHTYSESTVLEIVEAITNFYAAEFDTLRTRLSKLKQEESA